MGSPNSNSSMPKLLAAAQTIPPICPPFHKSQRARSVKNPIITKLFEGYLALVAKKENRFTLFAPQTGLQIARKSTYRMLPTVANLQHSAAV
jgi:hypothetical protein